MDHLRDGGRPPIHAAECLSTLGNHVCRMPKRRPNVTAVEPRTGRGTVVDDQSELVDGPDSLRMALRRQKLAWPYVPWSRTTAHLTGEQPGLPEFG